MDVLIPGGSAAILILGGTAEGNALAHRLAPHCDAVTSLAGRTGHVPDLPGRVRVGGFGGADGLADWLAAEHITALVDATHPFAARMAAQAAEACRMRGIPRLKLVRPPWPRQDGDRWIEAGTMTEAARLLPRLGKRPFLTVGVQELDAFAGLTQALVRLLAPRELPTGWRTIIGRPPFSDTDEIALMQAHAIDVVVSKHSGGAATYAKIAAARALSLPVLMIRRPDPPQGPMVTSFEEAAAWVETIIRREENHQGHQANVPGGIQPAK